MIEKTSSVPKRSSLSELRAIAQPAAYSPSITDRIYRAGSIFFSVPLAGLGISPNAITLGWIALGLVGVGALLGESWGLRVAGAVMLQLSYLLDYVDGEVARLTDQKSRTGEFLDLIGHGLIKASLPLAVGSTAAMLAGSFWFLGAAAVGAVVIVVGDTLRFYAACASGDLLAGDLGHVVRVHHGERRITVVKVVRAAFELSFETPGLYGLALVAAVTDMFAPLALYWAAGGALWLVLRARRYCDRLGAQAV